MSRPLWFVNFLKRIYPSRQPMARLTHVPLIGRLVDHFLFRDDEIITLPKDDSLQINHNIDQTGSAVLPSRVVDHFIREANHHWVMDFCICREGDHCQEYSHQLGCIFLGQSVTKINSDLGRRVSKEEALNHAQRCREEGLVHTLGRNRLDAVWLGAFPSDRLMTICNCCPCCCLWGLVPDLTPEIGDKITKMPGVRVTVNDQCNGCGACVKDICVMGALTLEAGRAAISSDCRGCGRCVEICPKGAIELEISDPGCIQGTIDRISPLVDLT